MEHNPILPASASLESIERFLPSDLGIAPLSAVACALSGFNRDQLGSAIEVMIALMDVVDGDVDVEPNGDEEDGDGDERGDQAWIEWTTMRGSQKSGSNLLAGHEDDEDDDPDTSVEDDPLGIDPEEDVGIDDQPHDQEEELTPDCGIDQTKSLPDAMVVEADRVSTIAHRNRIRRTRCVPRYSRYRDHRTGKPDLLGFMLLNYPSAPTRRQLLKRKRGVPRRPRA